MAISVNKVILVGNVGADPEVVGRDGGIVKINVATSDTWRDKATGERQERTNWHKVVIFNEQAGRYVKDYVKKGDMVYIEGSVETRKWTKDDGSEVYITEILVRPFVGIVKAQSKDGARGETSGGAGGRADGGGGGGRYGGGDGGYAGRSSGGSAAYDRDLDDEIPF